MKKKVKNKYLNSNKKRGKRKTKIEIQKIKCKKLAKEKHIQNKAQDKKLKESLILKARDEKEKQKYVMHDIKVIENITQKRERKKKNKIPNIVLINHINKDSINIYDDSCNTLRIYGKAAYIIYYILKEKRDKYKSVKKIKLRRKIYNKAVTTNYIMIPMIEKNYILENLRKLNINYYIISKRLGHRVLEKEIFENNQFKKIYKLAKRETKKEKTLENILKEIKYMDIELINELIQLIKTYDKNNKK